MVPVKNFVKDVLDNEEVMPKLLGEGGGDGKCNIYWTWFLWKERKNLTFMKFAFDAKSFLLFFINYLVFFYYYLFCYELTKIDHKYWTLLLIINKQIKKIT